MSGSTNSACLSEETFTTTTVLNVSRDATLHFDAFREARLRMDSVVGRKSCQYGSVRTGAACQTLHRVLHQQHSGTEPHQYSSNADVDLSYHDPDSADDSTLHQAFLVEVENKLREKPNYRDISVVAPRNGVVVLKCVEVIQGVRDPATGVVVAKCHARHEHPHCNGNGATNAEKRDILEVLLPIEITVNNQYAVMNSILLEQYMTCSLAKNLVLRVKRWAKSKQLVRDARNGLLSSFAYSLMVVSFLQSRKLLPRLQDPQDENYMRWYCGERWDWAALSDDDPCVRNLDFLTTGWSGIRDTCSTSSRVLGSADPSSSWSKVDNRGSTMNMRALILELLEHEKLAGGGTHKVVLDDGRTKAMLFLSYLEVEFFRFLNGRIESARGGTEAPNVVSITRSFAPDLSGLGGGAVAVEDPFVYDMASCGYRVLRCNDKSRFDTVCKAIEEQEKDRARAFAELNRTVLPSRIPPLRPLPALITTAPSPDPAEEQCSRRDGEPSSAEFRLRSQSRERRCSLPRELEPNCSPRSALQTEAEMIQAESFKGPEFVKLSNSEALLRKEVGQKATKLAELQADFQREAAKLQRATLECASLNSSLALLQAEKQKFDATLKQQQERSTALLTTEQRKVFEAMKLAEGQKKECLTLKDAFGKVKVRLDEVEAALEKVKAESVTQRDAWAKEKAEMKAEFVNQTDAMREKYKKQFYEVRNLAVMWKNKANQIQMATKVNDHDLDMVAERDNSQTGDINLRRPEPVTLLKTCESSWISKTRELKQAKEQDEDAEDAAVHRKLKSLMNKLTEKNFDAIYEQIIALLKKQRHVEVLVQEVFEKAVSQHLFIDLYTSLTKKLSDSLEHHAELFSVDKSGKKQTFRVILLAQVQDTFEQSLTDSRDFEMRNGINDADEKCEAATKGKTRITGNVKFIGNLLRENLLASKIFVHVAGALSQDESNDLNLEMLCMLCETTGTAWMSGPVEQWAHKELLPHVRALSKDKKIKPRVRFMIQDLVDRLVNAMNNRKNSNWYWEDWYWEKKEAWKWMNRISRSYDGSGGNVGSSRQGRPASQAKKSSASDWDKVEFLNNDGTVPTDTEMTDMLEQHTKIQAENELEDLPSNWMYVRSRGAKHPNRIYYFDNETGQRTLDRADVFPEK